MTLNDIKTGLRLQALAKVSEARGETRGQFLDRVLARILVWMSLVCAKRTYSLIKRGISGILFSRIWNSFKFTEIR